MMGVVLKVHRRRQWHPTPVLLSGKPHGRRSLVGCSPWGREESDTTERLHFHFSLSLFTFMHWRRTWQPTPVLLPGESQGRGSLVAAVYGVAQSRTRLKRFSSSNSSIMGLCCPHTYIYHTAAEFYQVYLVGATWCQNDDPEEINTLNNQSCKPKPTEWLELRLISLLFFIILHLILKV